MTIYETIADAEGLVNEGTSERFRTQLDFSCCGATRDNYRVQCGHDHQQLRNRKTDHTMDRAEERLWRLRQGDRELERYVEDFIELSDQVGWPDASLGAVFLMGLSYETIRCDSPSCNYSLSELLNLILYLNGSDFEIEEVKNIGGSRHSVPSETQYIEPAHPEPRAPTYRTNDSRRLPSPKSPILLRSSAAVLSPMRLASSPRSNPPATAQSPVPRAATPASARKMAATPASARKMAATPASARKMAATPESARKMASVPEPPAKMASVPEPPAKMASVPEPQAKMAPRPESPVMIAEMNIMDRAIPLEFTAPIISPNSPEPPLVPSSLPEPPLVPSSLPEPPLVPSSLPEPPLVPSSLPEPPLVPPSLLNPPLVPPSLPESSQVVAVFPESSHVTAESSHVTAESSHVTAESSHVTAESSHVTATSPDQDKVQLALQSRSSAQLALQSRSSAQLALQSRSSAQLALLSRSSDQLALQSRSSAQLALQSRSSAQLALQSRSSAQLALQSRSSAQLALLSRSSDQLALQSRSSVQLALLSRLLLQRALLSRLLLQRDLLSQHLIQRSLRLAKILGGGYPPWPPELFTRPWPPEPPDPPWPPELFTRPWPPEPPDPPWPPELFTRPWPPEPPDPTWPPERFTRPWPPEPPDPPWPPELSVRPCPPELPDPPWLPDLPWRLSLATMFLSRISLQGAHPPSLVVLLRCGTHLPGGGPLVTLVTPSLFLPECFIVLTWCVSTCVDIALCSCQFLLEVIKIRFVSYVVSCLPSSTSNSKNSYSHDFSVETSAVHQSAHMSSSKHHNLQACDAFFWEMMAVKTRPRARFGQKRDESFSSNPAVVGRTSASLSTVIFTVSRGRFADWCDSVPDGLEREQIKVLYEPQCLLGFNGTEAKVQLAVQNREYVCF
ncbi:IgA FC receptor [Labeo rohita]|uniref:IgA FC receptor n=1 Tax=Labeo rohita TaxID=84645 RepID=A0ABQ8LUJ5_LABRO|nr:IgA FC receptor [Labeo rohita]